MTDLIGKHSDTTHPLSGTRYQGSALRHVAMPLGGLGTGQIALGGDGGLRQWQITNQVNHRGFVPDSFFAIRTSCVEPPLNTTRILQSRETLQREHESTPLVNDDMIPADQLALLQQFTGVEHTTFTGSYPFGQIRYEDEELPIEVDLEAYSPFIPLDAHASGLPAIIFTFTLHNPEPQEIRGVLGATLQNAVGWDGITPINGNRNPLYGGNVNRLCEKKGLTALIMENPSLADDHPGAGQMVLTHLADETLAYERWTSPEQFIRMMEGYHPDHPVRGPHANQQRGYRSTVQVASGASAPGETWNGGLLFPFWLAPDETVRTTFILSWYFPNRYVNFDQFGPQRDYGRSRFWLGNEYATRFDDAMDVTKYVIGHQQRLEEASRRWAQGIATSTLPPWMNEALAAQGSLMRSPTCFWTEDGRFYGFEGSLGVSTSMWSGDLGGSCPLNCTHVWNYEQALSRLFPHLERSMRDTDLKQIQAPEGYIPHRTILPLYLPQLWNEPIGGPTNPALDGMLGTVLKSYREFRQGAGQAWLDEYWPHIKQLMGYIITHWDQNGDGVLEGEQPNTYDIEFYGPNMYIGGLWLAALRAAEELSKIQGQTSQAAEYRQLFECGRQKYDELLWNGEYYIQLIDHTVSLENQFGEGCLADQLFGQWWAQQLGLGYILPREHVRRTLQSIVSYNFRESFHDFSHGYRVFADQDDAGLLLCTWPHGGRPKIPVRYCDEVWTGIEYQVGAHCITEGLVEEGLKILAALRARYNGTRRNPYNEIECGDHYARAMAGWSMLEAISGFQYNAHLDALWFQPALDDTVFRAPFIVRDGWGVFEQQQDTDAMASQVQLTCAFGEIHLSQLTFKTRATDATVTLENKLLESTIIRDGETCSLTFTTPVVLRVDTTLFISFTS